MDSQSILNSSLACAVVGSRQFEKAYGQQTCISQYSIPKLKLKEFLWFCFFVLKIEYQAARPVICLSPFNNHMVLCFFYKHEKLRPWMGLRLQSRDLVQGLNDSIVFALKLNDSFPLFVKMMRLFLFFARYFTILPAYKVYLHCFIYKLSAIYFLMGLNMCLNLI